MSQIGVRLSDFVAVTLESFSTGGGSDNQEKEFLRTQALQAKEAQLWVLSLLDLHTKSK